MLVAILVAVFVVINLLCEHNAQPHANPQISESNGEPQLRCVELELLLYESTAAKTLAEDALKKKHAAWDAGHQRLQADVESMQRDLTSDGGGDLRLLLEQQVARYSFTFPLLTP